MAALSRRELLRFIPSTAVAGASLAVFASLPTSIAHTDPWQALMASHPDHRDWPAVINQAMAARLSPRDIRHVTQAQNGPRRGRLFLSSAGGTVIITREGVE